MSDPYHDAFTPRPVDQPHTEVAFGPKPYQVISAEVASMILTDWKEHAPAEFGKYLARAMTGVNPRGGQGGKS